MCALCGIVERNRPVDRQTVLRMARTMAYRGPDEEGYYVRDNVGLGHRRLKIIDLVTGQQPLGNEDRTVYVVLNGEIYNFAELRARLEKEGHRFRSHSDTEVVVHLYEELGVECLKELRGMFALALWDDRRKCLLLARDRVGKKPLVYAVADGAILFASEIKALLQDPRIRRDVDVEALDLYLSFTAVPSPHTIFRQIRKLPPAHWLLWQDGQIEIRRYWDVDFTKKVRFASKQEYADLLWEKLREAVRLRMIADVPLGAFLSGGIDSSTVVGLMSELSSRPVKTFSVGFQEEDYSELPYARAVARRFSTEHHEFVVRPDIVGILPKLVWHYNEPFGDSSMVPSYYVAQQTRKHVTVALNGDGGDENLAGYTRYWQTLIFDRIFRAYRNLPAAGRRRAVSLLNRGESSFPGFRLFRMGRWLAETEHHGIHYAHFLRIISFSEDRKDSLFSPWMKEQIKGPTSVAVSHRIWEAAGDVDLLEKMLYSDLHLYMPEVLMVKMDIATMAHALEGRSPFLDHRFIETAASFPPSLKWNRGVSKYILKRKLRGYLPDGIVRRTKMGFGIPLGLWFRQELKGYLRDVLMDGRAIARPYFNPESVKTMLEEHLSGSADHSHRLWLLLNFELWNRIFMDGENPS